jgi:hypothetical protein
MESAKQDFMTFNVRTTSCVSHFIKVRCVPAVLILLAGVAVFSQTRPYPKEIRGYKVERAAVELKSTDNQKQSKNEKSQSDNAGASNANQDPPQTVSHGQVDQLITFGPPELGRITPLGITLDIPIVVAPIKQSGKVDFLLFEDMTVNNHSIEIDEYRRGFDLPNKRMLTLREPLRFLISTPVAALAAVDEWNNSKETWPVTGRVYVCGKFRKFLISFKRCVPVELELAMKNPLKSR